MTAPPAPMATSAGPVAMAELGAMPATDCASTSEPLMDDAARPGVAGLVGDDVGVIGTSRDGGGCRTHRPRRARPPHAAWPTSAWSRSCNLLASSAARVPGGLKSGYWSGCPTGQDACLPSRPLSRSPVAVAPLGLSAERRIRRGQGGDEVPDEQVEQTIGARRASSKWAEISAAGMPGRPPAPRRAFPPHVTLVVPVSI